MRTFLKVWDKSGSILKKFDSLPDSDFIQTYGWLARIKTNGYTLQDKHEANFNEYIQKIMSFIPSPSDVFKEEVVIRPTIQDYMKEKAKEYVGDLEGVLDDFIKNNESFSLYNDLKIKSIPKQYCDDIIVWLDKKTFEFTYVYKSTDTDTKEGYSNLNKRKISQIIKFLGECVEDVERYVEFRKANRKPKTKKAKPSSLQITKLKYLKYCPELNIDSVSPIDIVGASQVWVYNTKYKKLAVYRTDSTLGIQVKGSSLQNYDPELSDQKVIRRPEAFLPIIKSSTKIKLRKIMDELTTKGSDVSGRINEECIILRVIK